MCGLTGYFYFDERREISSNPIKKMLALQKHRGPDDTGIVAINTRKNLIEEIQVEENQRLNFKADLMLGFNRLSILDLSRNGHQPMMSANNQVVLMINGEIYNAFDFREKLILKGYSFRSKTDTEIVLNLYLEYGFDRMVRMLNGMFAIVIYDAQLNKLYLARDRFGIKPLYILIEKGRMAFSSEIKSFKALPEFNFELNYEGLDEFLLFRNLINRTLFKKINNLTPGTYLEVGENRQINTVQYYDIKNETASTIDSSRVYSCLDLALKSSVKRQMISDVKLGVQLSGGVDSSLITFYASEVLKKGNVETISIVFNNPRFSEEKYINQVINYLNVKAHKYLLDADYYFTVMEKAIWYFEQPLNHPNSIGIYLLSQRAKKHVTVLLSGEGADEAFAGYERFVLEKENPFFNRLFLSRIKREKSLVIQFFKYYKDYDSRIIMASAFGSLFTVSKLKLDFSLENALEFRKKILNNLHHEDPHRYRRYELLTYLPDLLMRQDKMSMAHSIENRVPFLDNEMVHLALNLPEDLLVNTYKGKKEGKFVLKKFCAQKFDESFAFRNKMGFGIPLKEFMSSSKFNFRWNEQILPGIKKRGIFQTKYLNNWFENIQEASSVELEAIWLMSNFEMWAQQYIDK